MSFAEVGLKGRYAEGLFNAEHSTAECLWKCRWIYGRGICYTITLSHLRFFLHFTPSLHAAFAHVCSRLLTLAHANYVPFRAFTYLLGLLHVPFRALLTFAHVGSRLLTFAHVCSRISSSWSIHVLFRAWDLKKYMVQHDIRAFLLGPQTLKSTSWLLVAMYLLGPLFAEIAKTLQSRSLDFQGNVCNIYYILKKERDTGS